MRTTGILRAARAETQNAFNAISIVFPNEMKANDNRSCDPYDPGLLKIYVFFIGFFVCHVILNVEGPQFSNSSKHN